jgi:hypothetical protein
MAREQIEHGLPFVLPATRGKLLPKNDLGTRVV